MLSEDSGQNLHPPKATLVKELKRFNSLLTAFLSFGTKIDCGNSKQLNQLYNLTIQESISKLLKWQKKKKEKKKREKVY